MLTRTTTSGGGYIYSDSEQKKHSETIEVPNKVVYINLIDSYKKHNIRFRLITYPIFYTLTFLLGVLIIGISTLFPLFLLSLIGLQLFSIYFQIFIIFLSPYIVWQFYITSEHLVKSKYIESLLPICFKNEKIKLDENNEEIISIEIFGKRKNVEYVKQTLKDCSDIDFIDSKLKILNPWKNFKYFSFKQTIK